MAIDQVAIQYQRVVGRGLEAFPDDADLLDLLAFKIKDLMQMPPDPAQDEVANQLLGHFNEVHRANFPDVEFRNHLAGLSYSQIAKELRPVFKHNYTPEEAHAMERGIVDFSLLCQECGIDLTISSFNQTLKDEIDGMQPGITLGALDPIPNPPASNQLFIAMPRQGTFGYVSSSVESRNLIEKDWYETRKKKLEKTKTEQMVALSGGVVEGGFIERFSKIPELLTQAQRMTEESFGNVGQGFFGAVFKLVMTLVTMFQLVTGTDPGREFSDEELNAPGAFDFNNQIKNLGESARKKLISEWRNSPNSEGVRLQLVKELLRVGNNTEADEMMDVIMGELTADIESIINRAGYREAQERCEAIEAALNNERAELTALVNPTPEQKLPYEKAIHDLLDCRQNFLVQMQKIHENRYDQSVVDQSLESIERISQRVAAIHH